ncbi:MAG TPA: hypothetical protein VIH64_17370, partial [Streptosporangiaceae bacterium]
MPPDPVAARISALTGTQVQDLRPAGAQHGTTHYRATLTDGREVFAKLTMSASPSSPTQPSSFTQHRSPTTPVGPSSPVEAEARGLNWLSAAGAVPIPEVLG